MVFVNARSACGRATERQVIEVHPPAAVPRIQRRVRCKAQVLQVRLGFVEPGGRLRGPVARRAQGGARAEASAAPKAKALAWELSRQGIARQTWSVRPLRTGRRRARLWSLS